MDSVREPIILTEQNVMQYIADNWEIREGWCARGFTANLKWNREIAHDLGDCDTLTEARNTLKNILLGR